MGFPKRLSGNTFGSRVCFSIVDEVVIGFEAIVNGCSGEGPGFARARWSGRSRVILYLVEGGTWPTLYGGRGGQRA